MTRSRFRTSLWLVPLGFVFVFLGPSPAPAQLSGDGTYVYAPWTPASASTIGDGLRGMTIQTDSNTGQQRILVAGNAANTSGYSYVGTARYLPDGAFDPGYGTNGVSVVGPYRAYGSAIAVQDDGKAIVAGENITGTNQGSNFFLVRCTSTGQLDPSFNGTGTLSYDVGGAKGSDQAREVAIQSSGKIVVAGASSVFANGSRQYPIAVARFQANGTLDTGTTGFGQAGKGGKRPGYCFTTPIPGASSYCLGMTLQDDKPLVVGYTGNSLLVIRYTPDGDLDPTFNGTGVLTTFLGGYSAAGVGVTVDPASHCLIISGSWRATSSSPKSLFVARLLPNGSLDPSFNQVGFVATGIPGFSVYSGDNVALQNDGRILVVSTIGDPTSITTSEVGLAVTRFNSNGSLDLTFGNYGSKTVVPDGSSGAGGGDLGILADGTIIAGGNYTDSTGRMFPMLVKFLP